MEETPQPQISRPLDIGYELLPDRLSALDFIEYDLVRLTKPTKYRKDKIPPHDLFGDKAVIRRELLEDEPIEHSELWLKIVSKLNPELIPRPNDNKYEEPEHLPCHLVDEPMHSRYLPSLIPRKVIEQDEKVVPCETEKTSTDEGEGSVKTNVMFDFEALDKLKETVNWLKYCEEGSSEDDTESE